MTMTISLNKTDANEERLTRFFFAQKNKIVSIKRKYPSLDIAECEDIFQDAIEALWKAVNEGKVAGDKLEGYFGKTCKNLASKKASERTGTISIEDEDNVSIVNILSVKVDRLLEFDLEESEKKENAVRSIINDLPKPCNEILWGYYGNGETLKSMADELYSGSVASVRVTKHRCFNKFRMRYFELLD
jgi:RNA polymerase sigma factor (sigma-70 family)